MILRKLRSLGYLINWYILAFVSFLKGHGKYYCPCCGEKIKYYKPYGTYRLRLNAECPKCGAAERDRIEKLFYIKKLSLSGSVLHFAPERIQFDFFSKNNSICYYMPVDINEQAFGVKQKEDITELSFKDDYFDYIVCNHVIEHIKDDEKAIRELSRVLKPNGKVIITVPYDKDNVTLEESWINTDKLRIKYYGEADHQRMNGIDFEDKLARNGLVGEKVYADFLLDGEMKAAGLKKEEFFFLCKKGIEIAT